MRFLKDVSSLVNSGMSVGRAIDDQQRAIYFLNMIYGAQVRWAESQPRSKFRSQRWRQRRSKWTEIDAEPISNCLFNRRIHRLQHRGIDTRTLVGKHERGGTHGNADYTKLLLREFRLKVIQRCDDISRLKVTKRYLPTGCFTVSLKVD